MRAQDRFDLSGKVALVTGASRGIGRTIAIGMAEHGADICLLYRAAAAEAESAADTVRVLGRRAWVFQQDLARTEEIGAATEAMWTAAARIDILVNNAGIAYLQPFSQITLEQWRHVMAVNLDAVFFLTQAISKRMIAAGIKGRVINVSSTNGLLAEAGLAHYNASKGGLELLTKSLAIELGEHGITVNSIAPGIVETEIAGEFDLNPGFFLYLREHIPLEHRLGSVEDCVGAAVFLASQAGSYITGQHIVIDGGLVCQQFPRMQFMQSLPTKEGSPANQGGNPGSTTNVPGFSAE